MACCALTEGAEASRPQRRSRPPRQEKTPQQPRPHRATLRGFCLLPASCPRCPPGPAASPAPAPPSICVPRSTMPPRLWCWPRPCPPTCSRWLPWRSLGTPGTQGHQEEEEEAGTGRGSPHSHHASTTTAAAAASAAVRTAAQQCLWPGPASQWGVRTSRPSITQRCCDLAALTVSRRGVVTSWPCSISLAALLGLILSAVACHHRLHTPMYFFLLILALLDLGCISTTVPKAMANALWDTRAISIKDRACATVAAAAWGYGFINALLHTDKMFSLPLCPGNAVDQFFCEILSSTA